MGYIVRRFIATLPVMAVVAVVVFLLIHLSPGDPAALIAGDLATTEDIEKLRAALGLNLPLWQQFGLWIGKLFTGDLGTSIFTQMPVTQLLGIYVASFVLVKITQALVGLRVRQEVETQGLDLTTHGEAGYNLAFGGNA